MTKPKAPSVPPTAFDWEAVMRACMGTPASGGLGWSPREFWNATPREVAMALGREHGHERRGMPPTRGALEALLALHPDSLAMAARRDAGDGDG